MKTRVSSILQTLLPVLLLTPTAGDAFERLFTTRAERESLDAVRYGHASTETETPTTAQITVNGLVLGPHGENQVWINGSSSESEHRSQGYRSSRYQAEYRGIPLKIHDQPGRIRLRPGETFFTAERVKKDLYQWESADNTTTTTTPDPGAETPAPGTPAVTETP